MDSKFQKSIIFVFFTFVSFASSKGEMCYKLRKYELHNFAEADNTKKELSVLYLFYNQNKTENYVIFKEQGTNYILQF